MLYISLCWGGGALYICSPFTLAGMDSTHPYRHYISYSKSTWFRPLWVLDKCSWLHNDILFNCDLWIILPDYVILQTNKPQIVPLWLCPIPNKISWKLHGIYVVGFSHLQIHSMLLCMKLLVWAAFGFPFLWWIHPWLTIIGSWKIGLPIILP